MLTALARDDRGRPAIVLGLSERNIELLKEQPIYLDAAPAGFNGTVVIVRGQDIPSLKAAFVEMGVADRSLLDVDPPTPDTHQVWRPGARTSEPDT